MTPIPPATMPGPTRIILPVPVFAQRFGCWTWGEAMDIAQAIWPEVSRVRLELNFQELGARAKDLILHLPRLARVPAVRGAFELVMLMLAQAVRKATFPQAVAFLVHRLTGGRLMARSSGMTGLAAATKPAVPARRRKGGRR